ncbi:MAG: site-specific integrase [Tannerella sp.]|jgi:site-specific recombinase XerD|nr:site-specific integrase [Tannerella sp.]
MKSTFKILFYLKRDKRKANGKVPLFCRITVCGQESRFGMKKDLDPGLWDVKAGRATGRSVEAADINSLVDGTKSAIYRIYRDLQERENSVTAEKVKNTFLGINIKHEMLLEVFDEHNEEKKQLIGRTVSESTHDKYRITRDHLAEFLRKRKHLSDIPLKDINHEFIGDFEHFLLTARGCAENTTAKYIQFFKHIIIVALDREWIVKNPFANYTIRIKQPDRGYLTQEEVETLMKQKFERKSLERVRDIFLFCCFTGLSYIDVRELTDEHISTSFDGKLWIMSRREKTDISFGVPLLDIPKTILEKYRGKQPDGRLLPVVCNTTVNIYLKKIGTLCGIKKKLTFHLSRHTFATLTLTKGVSIESVSRMLGHKRIATTQIYAKITDTKVGNDMALFAGKIKDMGIQLTVNI